MEKIIRLIRKNRTLFVFAKLCQYILLMLRKIPNGFLNTCYSVCYYKKIKICFVNDLTIGIKELVNKKTMLPHPIGIVIGTYVELGYNCQIYQNVTIGSKNKNGLKGQYPRIGNNVVIYANSVVIGNIEIGDNTIIGAGSIVTKSIPSNAIAAGNPCRIIKYITNEE